MPSLEDFKKLPWYQERSQIIKDLICQFPYAATVRIRPTSQIAYVLSWFEDGTIRVVITEEDNPHMINALPGTYTVFGYAPDDLEFLHENQDLYFDDEA